MTCMVIDLTLSYWCGFQGKQGAGEAEGLELVKLWSGENGQERFLGKELLEDNVALSTAKPVLWQSQPLCPILHATRALANVTQGVSGQRQLRDRLDPETDAQFLAFGIRAKLRLQQTHCLGGTLIRNVCLCVSSLTVRPSLLAKQLSSMHFLPRLVPLPPHPLPRWRTNQE